MMLRDFFERLADENHIPYQTEVTTGSSEDSAEMQRFGSGIPSLNYAVATRYLHTHSSELDRAPFDQAIDLLVQVLNALDSKTVESIARF
jgi:putative aminopeptidase FrvX